MVTARSFLCRWHWRLHGILGIVEQSQAVAAKEARAAGLHWTFGPMLDIARDARWGRIVEGAGEDPYLGCGDGGGSGARLPRAIISARPIMSSPVPNTSQATARRTADAITIPVYLSEGPAAKRLFPALPGRGESRGRDVHERLHGSEQCPCERKPLVAA